MNKERFGNIPPNIVLWGGSGLAVMLRQTIETYGSKITAIIEDNLSEERLIKLSDCFPHSKILDSSNLSDWLQSQNKTSLGYHITIAGMNGRKKLLKASYMESLGLKPVTVVHPTAFVADDAEIGDGTFVDVQSIVMAKAKVGKHCNIGPNTNISHDDIIGDACDTSVHTTICGNVTIGINVCMGANVTIQPWLSIGDDVMIGTGAVVTKNIPSGEIWIGFPAKFYKKQS